MAGAVSTAGEEDEEEATTGSSFSSKKRRRGGSTNAAAQEDDESMTGSAAAAADLLSSSRSSSLIRRCLPLPAAGPLPPPLRGADGPTTFTHDSIHRRLAAIIDDCIAHNDIAAPAEVAASCVSSTSESSAIAVPAAAATTTSSSSSTGADAVSYPTPTAMSASTVRALMRLREEVSAVPAARLTMGGIARAGHSAAAAAPIGSTAAAMDAEKTPAAAAATDDDDEDIRRCAAALEYEWSPLASRMVADGATWDSAPWFWVENYFYARIRAACSALGGPMDPFAGQKRASLEGARAPFLSSVLPLVGDRGIDSAEGPTTTNFNFGSGSTTTNFNLAGGAAEQPQQQKKQRLRAALLRSLWGNRADLSLHTVSDLARQQADDAAADAAVSTANVASGHPTSTSSAAAVHAASTPSSSAHSASATSSELSSSLSAPASNLLVDELDAAVDIIQRNPMGTVVIVLDNCGVSSSDDIILYAFYLQAARDNGGVKASKMCVAIV